MLEGPCGLGVAFVLKPCLLILPDLTDHLLVEVLHDMEAVVDDREMRMALKECPLEVGVHVSGDGLHLRHPFLPDVVAQVVYDLLLLEVCKPQDMPHLKVYDHGGVAAPVVQLELVCAQVARLALRLAELPLFVPILLRVEPREPRLVDLFHDVPVKACRGRYRLEGLPQGKQVLREGEQRQRDAVAGSPEGDVLDAGCPALPARPSWAGYLYSCPLHPQREVPKRNGGLPIFLHRLSAAGAAWSFLGNHPAWDNEDLHCPLASPGGCPELLCACALFRRACLHEAVQMRGDLDEAGSGSLIGMGNGGQLGCRGCYTCHRAPSLFGVYMLRCKILEDGRFSVFLGICPQLLGLNQNLLT